MGTSSLTVDKPKLPKGRAYVLKTSLLVEALAKAEVVCHLHLIYWTPQNTGFLLHALYWMPNPNVPYRRVYVRAGSVASQYRVHAFELLQVQAVPAFITWLQHLIALSDASPVLYQEPLYDATYTNGMLQIATKPQVH